MRRTAVPAPGRGIRDGVPRKATLNRVAFATPAGVRGGSRSAANFSSL